ncbi:MAG TPA: isoprenylcysteine carboxylmethyltransferase family protein [Desulfuromonadales bacterium]|nr:isoprenylcysteine carboxylmethyltransferase family protein [Desulfuromonadales bacterium]
MSLWWVFGFYLFERALETLISIRNRLWLLAQGGRELYPQSYRGIVWLHAFFFVSLLIESAPWRVPFDRLTLDCLAILVFLQLMRYWGVAAAGRFWTPRLVVIPGVSFVRRGPFRFARHPNALIVTLEFVVLPLLMRSPLTLLFFTLVNLAVLRWRIRLEEWGMRQSMA